VAAWQAVERHTGEAEGAIGAAHNGVRTSSAAYASARSGTDEVYSEPLPKCLVGQNSPGRLNMKMVEVSSHEVTASVE